MRPSALERKRRQIEARIEELIQLLDFLDGDSEAEPGTWPEQYLARGYVDDQPDENLEDGHDAEDDRSDLEPALGWTRHIDQTKAPIVHAGGWQATGEDEPDLGWTGNGIGWTHNDGRGDTEANGDEADYSGYVGELDLCDLAAFSGTGQDIAAAQLRSIGRTMREPEPGSMFLRILRQ